MKWYIRFAFGFVLCLAAVIVISCPHDGGGGGLPLDIQATIDAGHESLAAEDYDKALEYYQTAYKADNTNPEAITYSVLAELAAISIDPKVKDLFQNRLGFVNYPNTMGTLFSTSWMTEYRDGDYSEFFPGLTIPAWFKNTEVYNDSLTSITGGSAVQSITTFPLLLAANLLDKNSGGLNDLFSEILSAVFGSKFEDIAARVNKLSPDAVITLDAEVTAALGLDELFEGDGLEIGKPELDVLIAGIRIVKATFEWIASYDWNSDFNFLKFDWANLDEYKAKLDETNVENLPFRNGFLKNQSTEKLNAAKSDYLAALAAISSAYDAIGNRAYIPQAARDEMNNNKWIKNGVDTLHAAIGSGSVFWVPDDIPSGETWNAAQGNAIFGIDMGKLFTGGNVTLTTMVEMTGSNPVFYGFTNDSDPGTEITSSSQIDNYDTLGFKIKLNKIKQLVPKGFDDSPSEIVLPLFPVEIGKSLYMKYYP
ncbi:MAG: hypothetical protein LBG07_03070 [Treponema sp.]|jgi:hypothetical protein|nr:hypothetical protein [Treponema sp.]